MNKNNRNNKTKNHSLDPMRIQNYNKFLSSLDEKEKDKIEPQDNMKNEEINKIIDRISKNFLNNNIISPAFSGQNQKDLLASYLDINHPNDYDNKLNKSFLNIKFEFPSILSPMKKLSPAKEFIAIPKKDTEVQIKETVNIETTIDNIDDLLKLIDTYKVDPCIQYNIDMEALHNIKDPLQELNNMIGMKELKNNIVDQIIYFIQKLHKNDNSTGEFLHTVIYGPPGTGKTEIAKIMGKIYSKIGILSKGTFKKVVRSDLIAGYLGQTALKTKDIINEAIGGVLFIDEAYSLGNPEKKDSFSKECIDTLCEALSDNKENLMVIIAGYEKELKECFFNYNQGLDSRFNWRFQTDEYSHEDLYNIFIKKVGDIGWKIDCTKIQSSWFKKNKEYFRYYGRDIETMLSKIKMAHSRRVFCCAGAEKKKITFEDLEKGFAHYLKNNDSKSKREEEEFKRYLNCSLYS